jgi:hypothetical protein
MLGKIILGVLSELGMLGKSMPWGLSRLELRGHRYKLLKYNITYIYIYIYIYTTMYLRNVLSKSVHAQALTSP